MSRQNRKKYYQLNKEKIKSKSKKYYKLHKAKILKEKKKYQKLNKKRIRVYQKKYRTAHKNKIKMVKNRWYGLNKEKVKIKHKKYKKLNKNKILEYKKKYESSRKRIDINFRISKNLRSRLGSAIKNNQKTGSAVKDLGCPVDFFKKYIESKFYGKMTWDNWGTYWQLDHIVPLVNFDLTDRKQFLKAANYKNMQPLTLKDHYKKTAKEMAKWGNN